MQQVNLISLMFAAQGVQSSATQLQASMPESGADFLLALQEQIWQGMVPAIAGQDDPALFQGLLDAKAGTGFTGLFTTEMAAAAIPTTTEAGKEPSKAAIPVSNTVTNSLDPVVLAYNQQLDTRLEEILGSLVQALREVLDTGIKAANPEPSTNTVLTGSQPGVTASVPEAENIWPTGTTGQTAIERALLNWQRILGLTQQNLSRTLSANVTVTGTEPRVSGNVPVENGLPWGGVIQSSDEAVDPRTALKISGLAGNSGAADQPAPSAGPINGDWRLPNSTVQPRSIQWFNNAGLSTTAPKAMEPVKVDGQQSHGERLVLSNDTVLQVSITPDAKGVNPGSYTVSVTLPGNEGVVLTGQLTVTRHHPNAVLAMPEAIAGSTAVIAPDSGTGGVHPSVTASTTGPEGEAKLTFMPVSRADAAVTVSGNAGPQAATESQYVPGHAPRNREPVVTVRQTTVTAEVLQEPRADRVIASDSQPVSSSHQVAIATDRQTADQLATVTRQAAIPVSGSTDQVTVQAESNQGMVFIEPEQTRAETEGIWQKLDVFTPTSETRQGITPGGQVAVTIAREPATEPVPQQVIDPSLTGTVNTTADPTPVELLQFTANGLQNKPMAGLEYYEAMQRMLAEVNAARKGGDGLYQARVNLNPPNLGQMLANISVRGDSVAIQLAIVSTTPREQLKDSLATLRESLEEAGLDVVELRIVTLDPEHNEQDQGQSRDQQQANDSHQGLKSAPVVQPSIKSTPVVS